MADLAVLTLLLSAFAAVLAIGTALPVRLLDWIDRHLLAPATEAEETP